MSLNKEKLLEMESSGEYLFHGSPNGQIEVLEPRQSTHVTDLSKPLESSINDGNPAVSATPYAQIAIFRAIVNGPNVGFNHTSGFGFHSPTEIYFRVSSAEVLEEIFKDKKGFVYVFNRQDFAPYNREGPATNDDMEWRSYKAVKPVQVLEVDSSDLPPKDQIEVF